MGTKAKRKRISRPTVDVVHCGSWIDDETIIGRAHTLGGVVRHVGYDLSHGGSCPPYRHRGLGWKVVVRGSQCDLERVGAVLSHGTWILYDAQRRMVAECEVIL